MAKRLTPNALLWCDLETPNLPQGNDYSKVPILEFAGVITDFDLTKFNGYHEAVKLEASHIEILRANPDVAQMHKDSGLLVDSSQSTFSLADIEEEAVQMLKDTGFQKGEFVLAGSGVAAFDHPLIKEHMPELASWLVYYTLDIGILRRSMHYLARGKRLVKPIAASYAEGVKAHRAMADVLAHIEEAEQYRDWLRSLPESY